VISLSIKLTIPSLPGKTPLHTYCVYKSLGLCSDSRTASRNVGNGHRPEMILNLALFAKEYV
jgi:hypothetical protein